MNFKDLRIIFMGTPDFAVASLEKLVQAGCNIVAVVTAPDRPAGRGMQLQQSAVKKFALANDLVVLQPEKLKSGGFPEELRQLRADLQAVVAFRMLPEVIWNMPPMGTINIHASLLPQYRGAAPINWAIINGENVTGVTSFKLQQEIDTGNILLAEKTAIADTDDAGSLLDKLKTSGADLLLKTVIGLAEGKLTEQPQPDASASLHHAPKIFTETSEILWQSPVEKIYNLVRGLSPYPGAHTMLHGKMLKIFSAEKILTALRDEPGTVLTDGKTFLRFAAANGYLDVKELQPAGKKKMAVADFLRGFRVEK